MNNGHDQDLEQRMQRAERMLAALVDVQDDVLGELRTLAKSQVLMSESLDKLVARMNAFVANTDERFAETTDKLNALIGLMDQHLRDHRDGRT